MEAMRESLVNAMRQALSGHSLLVEPGDHPDRYPTLRVRYEGSGEWYAALRGREGPSYSGTESDVFVPVELRSELVDWSRAVRTAPDGTQVVDEELRQAVTAEAEARHIEANIHRWADSVLHTLRSRGVLAGAL